VGKLYRSLCTFKQFNADFRIGFYGGKAHGSHVFEPLDIAGRWARFMGEINARTTKNKDYEADGLSGELYLNAN
jgi:hypothetical protein